ncbi:Piwi-like protein 4, partial [Manis javanica]
MDLGVCTREKLAHVRDQNRAKAFDGVILFLSQKLEEKVTELLSETQRGETVKMIITLMRSCRQVLCASRSSISSCE